MDLLLVSPVTGYGAGLKSSTSPEDWEDRIPYFNRETYLTDELKQQKLEIYSRKKDSSFDFSDKYKGIIETLSFEIYRSQNEYFAIAYMRIIDNEFIDFNSSLEIEETCNEVMSMLLKSYNGVEYLWVNRTIVGTPCEIQTSIPPRWIMHETQKIIWEPNLESSIRGAPVECKFSWGNNQFTSEIDLFYDARPTEIIRGMIDAQGIWMKSQSLLNSTKNLSHNLVDSNSKHKDKDKDKDNYSDIDSAILKIKENKIILDLAVDELNIDVQGARRDSALACYSAWNLGNLHSRLEHRIETIDNINKIYLDRRTSKNREWINTLLLALSVLTVFQFILSVVDIAYLQNTIDNPAIQLADFGFATRIRYWGIDLWLLISAVSTLLVSIFAFRKNKRI